MAKHKTIQSNFTVDIKAFEEVYPCKNFSEYIYDIHRALQFDIGDKVLSSGVIHLDKTETKDTFKIDVKFNVISDNLLKWIKEYLEGQEDVEATMILKELGE